MTGDNVGDHVDIDIDTFDQVRGTIVEALDTVRDVLDAAQARLNESDVTMILGDQSQATDETLRNAHAALREAHARIMIAKAAQDASEHEPGESDCREHGDAGEISDLTDRAEQARHLVSLAHAIMRRRRPADNSPDLLLADIRGHHREADRLDKEAEHARDRRDALIREALDNSVNETDVALALGVPVRRVRQMAHHIRPID